MAGTVGKPRKKGTNPGWKPSSKVVKIELPEDMEGKYGVRLVNGKDEMNVQRKLAEGYEFLNRTNAPTATGSGEASKPFQYKELVAMVLPLEDRYCASGKEGQSQESRDAYIAELNRQQLDAKIITKNAVKAAKESGLTPASEFKAEATIN